MESGGERRGRRGAEPLERRLLAYLLEHQGSSPREIADALGEPLSRVRVALQRLRDLGLVQRGEEGHYYAVAYLVRGEPPAELRRQRVETLSPDLEAELADLRERVRRLEERLRRLEEALERRGCR